MNLQAEDQRLKSRRSTFLPLLEVDERVRNLIFDLHPGLKRWIAKEEQDPNLYRECFTIVGSAAEGAILARCFHPERTFPRDFEFEMDCMWVFASIDTTEMLEEIACSVDGKPGFVKLKKEAWTRHCLEESQLKHATYRLVNKRPNLAVGLIECPGLFVNADIVKEIMQDFMKFSQHAIQNDHFNKSVAAALLDVNYDDVEVTLDTVIEGPSFCTSVKVLLQQGPDQFIHKASVDNVASIRTPWPPEASGWATRNRKWPCKEDIAKVISLPCHLVAKSAPTSGATERDVTEWRWSFSVPEAALTRLYTDAQPLAFLVFKVIFYRHLKCVAVGDRCLTSYIIKTVMLWECENTDASDWSNDNLVSCVACLCVSLRDHLRSGHLQHYFIPEINVLDMYTPEHLEQLALILDPISCDDPLSVLSFCDVAPSDMSELITCIENLLNILEDGFLDVFKALGGKL